METGSEMVEPVAGHVDKAHLLQVMRDYLAQAEGPQISVEDFCALAGVSAEQFLGEFADIYSVQLQLLMSEIVDFDFSVREELSLLPDVLEKVVQYSCLFWARYGKDDFEQYERNLLKAGLLDYFQQTPEAAAITQAFNRQHWCTWLQEAIDREHLRMSISIDGFADFHGSMRNSNAINTAFSGGSNNECALVIDTLLARYLQRHLPAKEMSHA